MKRITTLLIAWSFGLLFAAGTCFAQMYKMTDLGSLGGTYCNVAGINSSGQVVGYASIRGNDAVHGFRTAPSRPINPDTDDLGTLGGGFSYAYGINDSGQVVGSANIPGNAAMHAFRTAPNSPIDPATDDLGTLGGWLSGASGINNSGQVVGSSDIAGAGVSHAFRTAPNSPINPASDDLGTFGGEYSSASAINDSGQVAGSAFVNNSDQHAFRTAANSPINPTTDDLGTLGGTNSVARGLNDSGQVVGYSVITGNAAVHAFRTAPNSPINAATDDLGTLGVPESFSYGINSFGEVVGWAYTFLNYPTYKPRHPFLYSNGTMHDLYSLIPPDSGCTLVPLYPGIERMKINDAGQIAADGLCRGKYHAVLLTPIYKALVRPPINADGSSVFKANRGVIPVRFNLTKNDARTCTLQPATLSITKTAGGSLRSVDGVAAVVNPDNGPIKLRPLKYFRTADCQYVYNLPTSQLQVGTYRVDISIKGIFVGHAVFALK